jgi:hypothetical protein
VLGLVLGRASRRRIGAQSCVRIGRLRGLVATVQAFLEVTDGATDVASNVAQLFGAEGTKLSRRRAAAPHHR